MAKLILHVGMPKTGSSYIQGVLNKNHKVIEENGNIRILGGIKPHLLACYLIDDSRLGIRTDINELKKQYTNDIEELLKTQSANAETVVISSEYFILCGINKLKEYFNRIFESIEVVISVRRQDKLIASGFNQDVKALARTSNLTWDKTSSQHMDYWEYCEKWSAESIDVKVIDYDYVKKEKEGLLISFLNILKIDYKAIQNKLVSPDSNSSNYSLSHSEVLLKLAMNRNGMENQTELLEEFRKDLKKSTEFKLPVAYEKVIAANYKQSNQKFITKYLQNNTNSELSFHNVSPVNTPNSFSWNPLNGVEDVLEFILKKNTSGTK
ncbi:hypothetical protein PL71_06465 [Pseudoalteromonas distincta]|uniref:Sulfotransferase domain-containing protein n=1 Tax=Pseudoalteromonas distincta TaxID=77608 RepID=A0ABT9GAC7_9GAMM|nr:MULTISPECIES: hypothetical protein [Pseudoalteromonas distincta group]KHM50102.1 hypothetical protein PL71_06465 [Pseudoalteromonas elyakovii]KID40831.1 hypothetical protein QT16_03215 [Pseudoalteromonas distincta]MDP4482830.1 hypothetical protein [Pseudoalteromonas elyakovii]